MSPVIRKTAVITLVLSLILSPLNTSSASTLRGITPVEPPKFNIPTFIPVTPAIDTESTGTWPSVYDLAAPTDLTITPVWGTDTATLSWTDTNAAENGYILQQVFHTDQGVQSFLTIEQFPANTTSATITIPKGKVSRYDVIAVNSVQGKSSLASNEVAIEGVPYAPTAMVVSPDPMGANAIVLNWKDSSNNLDIPAKWSIERFAPGTWPGMYTTETPSFIDTNAKSDILYTYTVKAVSASGSSQGISGSTTLLSPPKNFEVDAWPGSTTMTVTWVDSRSTVDHFELVYKQKDYDDSAAKTLSIPAGTQNTQVWIPNGATYAFKIRSVMKQGNPSPFSPTVFHVPTGGEVPPALPTDITLKATSMRIEIVFHETAMNVQQYLVMRTDNMGGEPFEAGMSPGAGDASISHIVTLIDDHNLRPGATYTYRIKAMNTYGETDFTSPVSIVLPPTDMPAPPLPSSAPINKIAFSLGSSQMIVDGVAQAIDPGNETQPSVSAGGRTLIPIRGMIEKLGGTVDWTASENKVLIKLNGKTVELNIGRNQTLVDGKSVLTDEPPQIINGRTMLPIRFVSENLGLKVSWESDTSTIIVQP